MRPLVTRLRRRPAPGRPMLARPGFLGGLLALAAIAILGVALYFATGGSWSQIADLCLRATQWLWERGRALVASF